MYFGLPILSLMIWIPVIGGIIVLLASNDQYPNRARVIALIVSLVNLALCVPLYMNFNQHTYAMQYVEHLVWIPTYGINYDLGVDGISLPLVILTAITTLLVVLSAWETIHYKIGQYLASFLIMQGMVIGVFCAVDAMLFYIFWEGMLIPMYLNIGIWGSENRSYAAIKFFLFTFLGSALMLVALLYLRIKTGSFYILNFYQLPMAMAVQIWVFLAFLLAFAVKVPMWPVHTWLPDAHTEAPAGGSVVLAALMLKMGAYGFLRFSLPITPNASYVFHWPMIILSLIAIMYIGFIAAAQIDMKKLIAYSSVAHMGFVTLGCFMIYEIIDKTHDLRFAYLSLDGALVQMISHAFGAGALFLAFGMLYERIHTRLINRFGGIAHTMPAFAAFFMIFAMSNVGLPGTSGFVGEFLVILSAFMASPWVAAFAATTLIIGAVYTLWMYKRVFYGPIANAEVQELKDINFLEGVIFVILASLVFFIGLYPKPLLDIFHASLGHLLELSMRSKLL